jgi:hypothetical protein
MDKCLNKKSITQSSTKTEEMDIISVSTVKKKKLIDDDLTTSSFQSK